MIKQIIFDFDGVLYPSTEENMQRILSNISLAVNKTKKIPSQDLLNEVWGLKLEAIAVKLAMKLNWTEKEQINFLKIHRKDASALPVNKKAQALILETLLYLKKQGKELFIITNRSSSSLIKVAKEINLDLSLFELIIGPDSLKNPHTGLFICKPNPLVVDHILKLKKSYKLKEFVFVGDSIRNDFELAKRTGLNFIALPSALHSYEEWEQVFISNYYSFNRYIASSFLEIKDLV